MKCARSVLALYRTTTRGESMRIYRGPFVKGGLGLTCILAAAVAAGQEKSKSGAGWTLGEPIAFNIPDEPLSRALKDFAAQSHLQLVYQTRDLESASSSAPLRGPYTAQAALERLLQDSDLHYKFLNEKTVSITRTAGAKTSAAAAVRLADGGPAVASDTSGPRAPMSADVANPGNPVADASDAQSEAARPELREVVITGSHIKGESPVGSPIRTVSRTDIEDSGYVTTQDLLQSLTDNFRGGAAGASADGTFSSGSEKGYNTAGGSGVNLHGLGATATLVLINGHRVAPSANGYFTDISNIPVSAIDHIDILTDGASAIYGSDAVAGVVNIVLKRSSNGVEAGLRSGRTTDGAMSFSGGNLGAGRDWTTGGISLTGDVSRQSQLFAKERTFTTSVPGPTSIFPAYAMTTISGAGQQSLGRFDLAFDAQYSDKKINGFDSTGGTTYDTVPDDVHWSGSVNAKYRLSSSWNLGYEFSGGEGREPIYTYLWSVGYPSSAYDYTTIISRLADQQLSTVGDILQLPAGPVQIAAGLSYRTEAFSSFGTALPASGTNDQITRASARRHVFSEYGELRVPVISHDNSIPGIEKLTASLAARHDHYSDFGNTTNPKLGIAWDPDNSITLRTTYSRAFRAPATGTELANSQVGTTGAVLRSFPNVGGAGRVPVLYIIGGIPNLQPETATNTTAGIDLHPSFAPHFQALLTYYQITYKNQISVPPFSANPLNTRAISSIISENAPGVLQGLVNSVKAKGHPYFDLTRGAFGPNALAQTDYLYDARNANLASTRTSGVDLSSSYTSQFDSTTLISQLALTYIDSFRSQITPSAPTAGLVNTVGYPAKFRLRAQETYRIRGLNATLTGNYVGSYPDTSAVSPNTVGSYFTLDTAIRYEFSDVGVLHGFDLSLSGTNVLNRAPPFVTSGSPFFVGSHYDAANANPLGRTVTLGINTRW